MQQGYPPRNEPRQPLRRTAHRLRPLLGNHGFDLDNDSHSLRVVGLCFRITFAVVMITGESIFLTALSDSVSPGDKTMGWFGPSNDQVWRQLSQEIGAEFIKGGFWKGNKVQDARQRLDDHPRHLYRIQWRTRTSPTPGCVPPT